MSESDSENVEKKDEKKLSYNEKVQNYHQKYWDDPIDIGELIYYNYEDEKKENSRKEIVYITSGNYLSWKTSYALNDDIIKDYINDIMFMNSLPYENFPKERRLSYLRILGQGIVASLSKNKADVESCLEQARYFHRTISSSIYKNTCLKISTIIFWSIVLVYCMINLKCCCIPHLCSAAFWGFVGAYLSICYKTGESSGVMPISVLYISLNIIIRFGIGIIFGVVVFYFLKSGFWGLDYERMTREAFSIIALAAGFSEKFVPNILEQYEKKLSKGIFVKEERL